MVAYRAIRPCLVSTAQCLWKSARLPLEARPSGSQWPTDSCTRSPSRRHAGARQCRGPSRPRRCQRVVQEGRTDDDRQYQLAAGKLGIELKCQSGRVGRLAQDVGESDDGVAGLAILGRVLWATMDRSLINI